MKGGDVRQFVFGGREFDVAGEADFEIDLPGGVNEFKAAGNGKMYGTQKRKLGGIDGIEVVIDNSRGDQEFLAEKQADGNAETTTITLADGSAWVGALAIEGDLKYNSASGTAKMALRGMKWEQR